MIEQLQDKQRKLIFAIKNMTYKRKELDFINSSERLIGLIGARGVGKTTLLLQYLSNFSLDEALYFSADDISIAAFGIVEIVETFYKLGGRIVVMAELLSANDGIGSALAIARSQLDTPAALALVVIMIGTLLLIEYIILEPIKREVESWR